MSMSGDICLLAELRLLWVSCPRADPTGQTFQQFKLQGRAPISPNYIRKHLSLSPSGTLVVAIDICAHGQEHWRVPHSSTIVKEAASASKTLQLLQPLCLTEFTAVRQANRISHEEWHPLHSASIYAILSTRGRVHVIDAKANRCVQSWWLCELHGPDMPSELAQGASTSSAHERDDAYLANDYVPDDEHIAHVLSWSKDGCKLAIASGASATRRARCSVLHFSGSFI